MVQVSCCLGLDTRNPTSEPPNHGHWWLLDTTGRDSFCPERSRAAGAAALRPRRVRGAAAQGDRCHPGHPGVGHPAPPPPAAGIQWDGSAWLGQSCGHCALNTGALALLEALWGRGSPIPASLVGASPASPSPGPPAAPPAQSRAVLLPQPGAAVGTGLGTSLPGANTNARASLTPQQLCSVRLHARASRSQGSGHNCRARGSVQ